ncbi:putative manganese efflux pump MntP [Clostridium gelidum]|uniref:Manganese efflux pump MntP n=1 Tax=Clostridium gelidum TaxID=704125 RepID=A0ABM7SYV3_9CLOT|nr:manganese efflux pump [Clostridium gelidum]BCZ44825.1 putative manganese efflux pump MntP [Clostridium gelidum]
MNLYDVVIIGIALAMDAFGVTLGIGINPILKKEHKLKFVLSFAFFQFLFTYAGGSLGYLFDTYITNISSIAGGIIIEIVGILIIIDGFKQREKELLIKNRTCVILGISVSIDALVIGFTAFHQVCSNLLLFVNSVLVGLITLFICTLGFFICRYIKKIKFVTTYANFFAGIALIFLGFKMIFF